MSDIDIEKGALLSDDGVYRYILTRRWGEGGPVVWVMLNPSTADADLDDPTIRRCIGFTKSWGYNALTVVNLFALRATDPKELDRHPSPMGPINTSVAVNVMAGAAFVVAAWGANVQRLGWTSVAQRVREVSCPVRCLGKTKDGHPRHPLYVKADTPLVRFP